MFINPNPNPNPNRLGMITNNQKTNIYQNQEATMVTLQKLNSKSGTMVTVNKKRSVPGLRTWSPTVLLAWLESS